jgi:hypothetical protein
MWLRKRGDEKNSEVLKYRYKNTTVNEVVQKCDKVFLKM